MKVLGASRAFSILNVLICLVSVSGVPVESGSIASDWSCFPCERLPEDTSHCIAKSYAHPYTCCKYIVCDSTCVAYEMTCDTASGSDSQLLHYSYTSQKCILPSESACSDSNNVCVVSSSTATAPVAMTTALPTTTAPTTAPSARCQLTNRSPISAAYDPSKQVAFTVIKTTDYQSQKPLVFDQLVLDVNSKFNLSTGILPPNSGTLFFHSTFGIPRTTTCYSQIFYGVTTNPGLRGIERSTSINNGTDFVSRNYMYSTSSAQQYFLDVKTTGYSDSLGMTSWTGFKISELFDPLSAFSGYLNADWTTTGIIPFLIDINLGDDWDSSGSIDHYAAPTSGLYFFALTTTANGAVGHVVAVCVNGVVLTELRTTSTNNPGTEIYTRSFATPLTVGDDVTAQLTSGTLHSSTGYLSTAFHGFLYRPTHGIQVIWSVHKTTSSTGPRDPLPFEYVMLNEGQAWSVDSSNVCVPVTGVYYLHVNAASQAYTKLNVQLLVNGSPLFDIRRDTNHYNGQDTRGRAFIKDLQQGDIVSIRIMSGTAIYSNANMLSSFTGFLLYPQ